SSRRLTPCAQPPRISSALFTRSLTWILRDTGSIPRRNPKRYPRTPIQSLAKQNRKPTQTRENNHQRPRSIASFCRLFGVHARPKICSTQHHRERHASQTPGRTGALVLWESATCFRVREAPWTRSRRRARVLRRQLLAFRIQDAEQVIAMRGIVHRGAVHIAEERLLGVERFDLRVELIHPGGVWKHGDYGVGAGRIGVNQVLFDGIAGERAVSNLSIQRGLA